jgi:hypothetical protein
LPLAGAVAYLPCSLLFGLASLFVLDESETQQRQASDSISLTQIIVPAVPRITWIQGMIINLLKKTFPEKTLEKRGKHEKRESIQEALVGQCCLVYKSTGRTQFKTQLHDRSGDQTTEAGLQEFRNEYQEGGSMVIHTTL